MTRYRGIQDVSPSVDRLFDEMKIPTYALEPGPTFLQPTLDMRLEGPDMPFDLIESYLHPIEPFLSPIEARQRRRINRCQAANELAGERMTRHLSTLNRQRLRHSTPNYRGDPSQVVPM